MNHPSYNSDTEHEVYSAIRTSARETRTTRIPYSERAVEILLSECDGESDADCTYWGITAEGNAWKVELTNV